MNDYSLLHLSYLINKNLQKEDVYPSLKSSLPNLYAKEIPLSGIKYLALLNG